MSDTPRPQDTECTTLEFPNEGVANGALSMMADFYEVEYDEEQDAYVLGDSK